MSRPFLLVLATAFLLAASASSLLPVVSRAAEPGTPAPSPQLNSEGDEWVEVAPAGARQVRVASMPPAFGEDEARLGPALARARDAGPAAVLAFVAGQPEPHSPLLAAAAEDARADLLAATKRTAPPPATIDACRVRINNGPCSYETIQAAVTAAVDGDTVKVSAGDYTENVDVVGKDITIVGGYDATVTALLPGQVVGTILTNVIAAAAGSVLDVSGASALSLRNLSLSGGTSFGAGLDVLGGSQVTLYNTDIRDNNGASGGGIYIGSTSTVTFSNDSDIYRNRGSSGGGAIVYGRLAGSGTSSDIYSNRSTGDGGGLYVSGGVVELDNCDVVADTAASKGGGIFVTGDGNVTLTTSVFVGESAPCCNTAVDGAGIYASNGDIVSLGGNVTILQNRASNRGGGLYLANGSTFIAAAGTNVGYDVQASNGNLALEGAGMFVENSTVDFRGRIINNDASTLGGGISARGATMTLTDSQIGGAVTNQPNSLSSAVVAHGVGLALADTSHVTLVNTTIANNVWLGAGGITGGGGALVTEGSTLTMTGGSIEGHVTPATGTGSGAALYLATGGRADLTGTQVTANTATTSGGAIAMNGGTDFVARDGAAFVDNHALGTSGGAIVAAAGDSITLDDVVLQANSAATEGGAVYLGGAHLRATNAIFDGNQAMAGNGGAVASYGAGTARFLADLSDCADPLASPCSRLTGNVATKSTVSNGNGGAIYNNGGVLALSQTVLDRSTAERGGAIFQEGAGAVGSLDNVLVHRNTSNISFGAGVRVSGGRMTIRNSTLADNTGGAGYSPGAVQSYLYGTIIWGNTVAAFGALTEAICNIDQGGTAGPATNPLFVSPASAGGEDYRLLPGSPAIDACGSGLGVDLVGIVRPVGEGYDMGAFEFPSPVDAPEEGQVRFALEAVGPNPSRGKALIVRFSLPSSEQASLELIDVNGRRVASREVGSLGPGRHSLDLVTGLRPAAGVYWVRLAQGAERRVAKVVVLP